MARHAHVESEASMNLILHCAAPRFSARTQSDSDLRVLRVSARYLLPLTDSSLQLTIRPKHRIQIALVIPRSVASIEELQTFGRAAGEFGIFREFA